LCSDSFLEFNDVVKIMQSRYIVKDIPLSRGHG
jgi:hypothetical protein